MWPSCGEEEGYHNHNHSHNSNSNSNNNIINNNNSNGTRIVSLKFPLDIFSVMHPNSTWPCGMMAIAAILIGFGYC